MSKFTDTANVDHLVGLWDFENGLKSKDTGLADGIAQNGEFFEDAEAEDGKLVLDDEDEARFEVDGNDDVFEALDAGTLRVRFEQDDHNGGSPDTLVSRGEDDTAKDYGLLDLRVTKDGQVEVYHLMPDGTAVTLTTPEDTFDEEDDVEVWYTWDKDTGATLHVLNHSTGDSFTETSDTKGLTLDVGDDDDEAFTFGAREKSDGGPFDKEFTGTMDYVAIYDTPVGPGVSTPSPDFEPTSTDDLLTLWEYETPGTNNTADDTAPKGGDEDGTLKHGATQNADGQLVLDGDNDHMVAGPDPDWQLDEGRIELVFNQDAGQSGDGTLISRDSTNNDDGGHLTIWANAGGNVEVRHQTETTSEFYKTPDGFFDKGDDVRVTYAWDKDGETGFFKVENLTQGTTYEEEIDDALTIDTGSTSEPFVVGASSIFSDDNSANNLEEYFDGKISYVAIYDKATPSGDFVVEGTSGDDLIDESYTGDPDGDSIDAGDNQIGNDDDVVDAKGGDDTILSDDGDDLVFAGSGDDSVEGGDGADTIFGDSGGAETTTTRESFEWDLAPDPNGADPIENGDAITGFTQNTGSVDVTFSILQSDAGVTNKFEDTDQNVAGIDTGGAPIDDNSSFLSTLNGQGNEGDYRLDFDKPVENVSFRVNDIDGDGIVRIKAFDADGNPVEIELTAGANLTLSDTDGVPGNDTADSQGGYQSDASPNYSILVDVPGPITRIEIEHDQNGTNTTGINITDVYFDVTTAATPEAGDDTLLGEDGDDLIFGEGGDDSIDGGVGNDTLFGDDAPEGTVLSPNLIVNGSFEDTSGAAPAFYGFRADTGIPGWTEDTGEDFDIHNDGRGGVNPTDGNNWLDLDRTPGNVRVGQDVAGIVDGETYKLTFDASDGDFLTQSGPGENKVNVYWGGELVGTVDPDTGPMQTFTFDLVGGAGNGNNRLEFEGTGAEDNLGASIDSVSLVQVAGPPEEDSGNDTIIDLDGDNTVVSGPVGSPDQDFPGDGLPADADPNDDRDLVGTGNGDDSISTGDDDDSIDAGGGNDTIDAGFDDDLVDAGGGRDFVEGGEGNDTITGGGGNDTIFGNEDGGNVYEVDDATDPNPDNDRDLIDAGGGNDVVFGGDDDDTIAGGTGADTLDGGLDEDVITGGDGDDVVRGGDGDDDLRGNEGDDLVEGGAGDDELRGDEGDDTIDGGDGDDSMGGAEGDDSIDGGAGNDTLTGGSGDDTLDGGAGDDSITGSSGSDSVTDTDGDNTIDTGITGLPDRGFPNVPGDADADSVPPGDPFDDRDTVTTGAGNDSIATGDDNDVIDAGDGDNTIDAGFDDDLVTTGSGNDAITLGEGSDTVDAGAGDDTIIGGIGNVTDLANLIDDNNTPALNDPILDNGDDSIVAGAGDDSVLGEDDNDTIKGGAGDDTLDGGIDDDSIEGGSGDDSIVGGQGADTLKGGTGDDTFDVGNYTDPIVGDDYQEGIGDTIIGGEDGDNGDTDVLDLSDAGPLKIFFDEDLAPGDRIDPTGQAGEAGKVLFYTDATKTTIAGELTFKEIENVIPCFTPGTLIATPNGQVPVEALREGDRVITRDNGIQEIRWTGARAMSARKLAIAANLRPILIRAGALGPNLPERDMMVSPQHRVLMTDHAPQLHFEDSEVLVAAKHLVNDRSILQMGAVETTYIHFLFDRHEVVLSDGAWTESFQPGDQNLGEMGDAQRAEIFAIFPELQTRDGLMDYAAARRSLKSYEAKLLKI